MKAMKKFKYKPEISFQMEDSTIFMILFGVIVAITVVLAVVNK